MNIIVAGIIEMLSYQVILGMFGFMNFQNWEVIHVVNEFCKFS